MVNTDAQLGPYMRAAWGRQFLHRTEMLNSKSVLRFLLSVAWELKPHVCSFVNSCSPNLGQGFGFHFHGQFGSKFWQFILVVNLWVWKCIFHIFMF